MGRSRRIQVCVKAALGKATVAYLLFIGQTSSNPEEFVPQSFFGGAGVVGKTRAGVAFLTGVKRGLRLCNLLRQEGALQLLMVTACCILHGLRDA